MTRIILAALAATLTGCSGPPGDAAEPAARAVDDVASESEDRRGVILFLGTSLTAGYGIGAERAYPALIGGRIEAAGLSYRVSNAGISGETSAGGLRRIEWALQAPVEVLVLELGANDGLRGLDPEQLRSNLDSIIRHTRARYPESAVIIAGMEAPPNLGEPYTTEFRNVFRELAAEHDAAFVPFLLEGVAGVDSLNQDDGIHPTAAGQRVLADNVWRVLEPVLRARSAAEQ